jgi:hypothetical protein
MRKKPALHAGSTAAPAMLGTLMQILSTRERSGTVAVHLEEARYEMAVRCTVPRAYPAEAPSFELQHTNLPRPLAAAFLARAAVGCK